MTTERLFLEDFAVGQQFRSAERVVSAQDIKAFAAQFDPQPFHLDDAAAAANKIFRGLAASGWHTAAITMGLLVEGGLPISGGLIGAGIDDLRWSLPVRPGDALHVESEVMEVRYSESRPKSGWLKVRCATLNQDGRVVQSHVATLLVPRRPD